MRALVVYSCFAIACALAGCGPGDPPKAVPAATGGSATAASGKVEAKKEEKHEKHEAPDSHGMPGMSELFKGDDKKEEKKDQKK